MGGIATIGPLPDNTVVIYRNNDWSRLGLSYPNAGFNRGVEGIKHGSDPGATHPDARRTVGLGWLMVKNE